MCMHFPASSSMLLGGPGIIAMLVWMPIVMLVCVAVIIGVIWWLVRWATISQRRAASLTPYSTYRFQEGYHDPRTEVPLSRREEQQYRAASAYEQPEAQYPEMPEQR